MRDGSGKPTAREDVRGARTWNGQPDPETYGLREGGGTPKKNTDHSALKLFAGSAMVAGNNGITKLTPCPAANSFVRFQIPLQGEPFQTQPFLKFRCLSK